MTPERARSLDREGGPLTREEWEAGWRYCCEFDGMLLNCKDAENPEADICKCQAVGYPLDAKATPNVDE